MTPEFFMSLATIVGAIGYVLYLWSILRGESKPKRMTWFLLASAGWYFVLGNSSLDATDTLPALWVNAVGATLVALLSIKYGKGGWRTTDRVALGGVILTCLVWFTTEHPIVMLFSAAIVDCLALWPTIKDVAEEPESEEAFPWAVTVVGCFLNILALDVTMFQTWQFDTAFTPLYLFAINATVLALILRPQLIQVSPRVKQTQKKV